MPEIERRALVTGATGFIGRHLVNLLVGKRWEVHAIVRPTSDCRAMPREVARHVDDGSRRALDRAVADASASVCFHLAGFVVANHRADDVPDLIAANVAFPARLAEALASRSAPLFLNAGTYWQHVEGAAYSPAMLYAATKQAAEDVLRFYAGIQELRVVTLKLPNSYGLEDRRLRLVSLLIKAAASGDPVDLSGGDQYIDLVHADDAARAFLTAAEQFVDRPAPLFSTFSVSSGAPIRVRDLVAEIEHVTERRIAARWGARPYRRYEMFEPWKTGAALPNWTPTVSLEAGIASLWAHRNASLGTANEALRDGRCSGPETCRANGADATEC